MPINKKLIFFKKRQHYDNEVNNGLPPTTISFIDETKEIITHRSVFAGLYNVQSVQPSGNADLPLGLQWEEIPPAVYDSVLKEDGTYIIQIQWGQAIYTGIFPYKDLHVDNATYANYNQVPLITTDEEIVLTSCGNIPDEKGRLYLKLARGTKRTTVETIANTQVTVAGMRPSLFIATSKQNQTLDGLTFKFRRII